MRARIGILLLAFALRVAFLAQRPLWYDEAFSVLLAERDVAAIVRGTAVDVQPPLYYFLLHAWVGLNRWGESLFAPTGWGENVFVLRWLSVALSLLVVALVYALARRWFSERVAVWAMFFSALAPFQIYHAQELRMYALFALGALLYAYAIPLENTTTAERPMRDCRFSIADCRLNSQLQIANRKSQIENPLSFLLLGALIALYAHALAILTLVAANVYLLFKRAWRAQVKLVAAQLIALFAFAPWLAILPNQIGGIQRAYWTHAPGLADVLQMLVVFTTHLPLPPREFALALFITLALFALATFELVRAFRRGAPPALGLVLAFALIPPVLMFALSYVMRPIFVPRGAIVSSLAYYILLAYLVARAPRAVPLTIAALIALLTLPFYYSAWGEWRRAPFTEANQFLRAHVQADDLILHDNKLSFFPMHFYDRTLPQEFLADPPGSSNDTLARGSQEALGLFPIEFDVAVRGRTRVWFVIFQTAIDEVAQEGRAHGNLSRLDALMRRGDVVAFGDVRIYRYETR